MVRNFGKITNDVPISHHIPHFLPRRLVKFCWYWQMLLLSKDIHEGIVLHNSILGFHCWNQEFFLEMHWLYVKYRLFSKAKEHFNVCLAHNVVTWTTFMAFQTLRGYPRWDVESCSLKVEDRFWYAIHSWHWVGFWWMLHLLWVWSSWEWGYDFQCLGPFLGGYDYRS